MADKDWRFDVGVLAFLAACIALTAAGHPGLSMALLFGALCFVAGALLGGRSVERAGEPE